MYIEFLTELENSNSTPVEYVQHKEFISGCLKAGSLISMLENKKINTTTLFSLILENPTYQHFFAEVTSSESFRHAILSMLYLHPSLVKSKITKSLIRKLNAKSNNRTRKTPVQQTLDCIKKSKK